MSRSLWTNYTNLKENSYTSSSKKSPSHLRLIGDAFFCTNSKRLNQVSERVKYKGPINYNGR